MATECGADEFDELKNMIHQLSEEINELKQSCAEGSDSSDSQRSEPVCWRCGQVGHLRLGCRVNMEHSRWHLNFRKPMLQHYLRSYL